MNPCCTPRKEAVKFEVVQHVPERSCVRSHLHWTCLCVWRFKWRFVNQVRGARSDNLPNQHERRHIWSTHLCSSFPASSLSIILFPARDGGGGSTLGSG